MFVELRPWTNTTEVGPRERNRPFRRYAFPLTLGLAEGVPGVPPLPPPGIVTAAVTAKIINNLIG